MTTPDWVSVITNAAERKDIDFLFALWKDSTAKRNGFILRDYMTDILPYLSEKFDIPVQTTFRRFVEYHYIMNEVSVKVVNQIVAENNDLPFLQEIAHDTGCILLDINDFRTRSLGIRNKRFYEIMTEKALLYDNTYIVKQLTESIPAAFRGGIYGDYKCYLNFVFNLAIKYDAPNIILYCISQVEPKLQENFSLRALQTAIVRDDVSFVTILLEKIGSNKVGVKDLLSSIRNHSIEIFRILLESDSIQKQVFNKWATLVLLLDAMKREGVNEFFDLLYSYIHRTLQKKALTYYS